MQTFWPLVTGRAMFLLTAGPETINSRMRRSSIRRHGPDSSSWR
jgi:hypothetical protein